jgi:hypothetical protein
MYGYLYSINRSKLPVVPFIHLLAVHAGKEIIFGDESTTPIRYRQLQRSDSQVLVERLAKRDSNQST